MPLILVVDDEEDLVWAVQKCLRSEGYVVAGAHDGVQALEAIRKTHPDLILLDIVMGRIDGLQVCRLIRQDAEMRSIPIIFLTALKGIEDRVSGLQIGADDYMVKPFDLRELSARVRALLRRSGPKGTRKTGPLEESVLVLGALRLNLNTRCVSLGDSEIQLTPAEFDLLKYLMRNPGRIFSGLQLMQEIWGESTDSVDTSLIRWHIMNLRQKLEADRSNPSYIRTLPHHGYMMSGQPLCRPDSPTS